MGVRQKGRVRPMEEPKEHVAEKTITYRYKPFVMSCYSATLKVSLQRLWPLRIEYLPIYQIKSLASALFWTGSFAPPTTGDWRTRAKS